MNHKIKFLIKTLGCKVNQYESSGLFSVLMQNGFKEDSKEPDIVIINSCAVTKAALKKSRHLLNSLSKKYPNAYILVIGCWPRAYPKEAVNVNNIMFILEQGIEAIMQKISLITKSELKQKENVLAHTERTRYTVKIQDGCDQFCSYCIIPFARSKISSRAQNDIIYEIEKATENGYREIILSGIHIGKYGYPAKNKLSGLIESILKIRNLGRVRLSSIEINEIDKNLIDLFGNTDNRLCPHLHIPLQSGSNRILKAMNRPYRAEDFSKKIKILRQLRPDIAITSDIIVGFPGEGEYEFQETIDLINELRLSRLHVFPFSIHEKTLAAGFDGKVSASLIKIRSKKLRLLNKNLIDNFNLSLLNKELDIVVRQIEKTSGIGKGKSEYYSEHLFKIKDIIKAKDGIKIAKIVKIMNKPCGVVISKK